MRGKMAATGRTSRIRRPVRREGAERYLFLTLVAFAGTVLVTRAYLELTGYPRIGGGELHIAHALFGGLFLFVAALLPLLLAGRTVYQASAVMGGIGIGLFIDEIGKFITTQNDYFYPAAAPLIYGTFLLVVLVYLRIRRTVPPDARTLLLTSFQLVEEAVEGDLQEHERNALQRRLAAVAQEAVIDRQRRLAAALLTYVESRGLEIAPDPVSRFRRVREWWTGHHGRWLGGRGTRALLVALLFVSGVRALVDLGVALTEIAAVDPTTSARLLSLDMLHLVVEGIAGSLLLAGSISMVMVDHRRFGATLAEYGLLVSLCLADLASFYLRQFATTEVALFHGLLLFGVVAYLRQLRREERMRAVAAMLAA